MIQGVIMGERESIQRILICEVEIACGIGAVKITDEFTVFYHGKV